MNSEMKATMFDFAMLMIFTWATMASGYNAFTNESVFWLVCFLLSATSFILQIKECINE